jgi:transaldolase
MSLAFKRAAAGAALASSLLLAACGVNSAGNETLLGINTGLSAASVQVAQTDVQAAIADLPTLCQTFAAGAAMTQGELAVLQSAKVKIPAATLAAISKLSTNGQLACNGTVAVLADENGYAAASVTTSVPAAAGAAPAAAN